MSGASGEFFSERTRRRRRHLFPEEANALLEAARRARGAKARRNFVLLSLALNAGLRVSDVRWLNLSDYRVAYDGLPLVTIRSGKGGVAREVFLSPDMGELLAAFVAECRGLYGSDGPMFSCRWCGFDGRRLSERQIENVFKAAALAAGISDEFSFRSLRATFGVFYWRSTRDSLALREQLGLKSVEATIAGYCSDAIDERAEGMRRFGEMVR